MVATVATFGTLICIASEAQDSARVKEAWGWLRASGLEVHVTCANTYLQALVKEVGGRGQRVAWIHSPLCDGRGSWE